MLFRSKYWQYADGSFDILDGDLKYLVLKTPVTAKSVAGTYPLILAFAENNPEVAGNYYFTVVGDFTAATSADPIGYAPYNGAAGIVTVKEGTTPTPVPPPVDPELEEKKEEAKKELDKVADEKKAEVDAREDLTQEQKDELKKEIDEATQKAKEKIDSAKSVDDVENTLEKEKEKLDDVVTPGPEIGALIVIMGLEFIVLVVLIVALVLVNRRKV